MKEKLYILLLAAITAIGLIRLKNYFIEPDFQEISMNNFDSEELRNLKYVQITDAWRDGNYVVSTEVDLKNLSSSKPTFLYPLIENHEDGDAIYRPKIFVFETDKDSIRRGSFLLRGQVLLRKLSSNEQLTLEKNFEVEENHIIVQRGRRKPGLLISFLMIFVAGVLFLRALRRLKERQSV